MIINIGFEFETQAISMALWKQKTDKHSIQIFQPKSFFKKKLVDDQQSLLQVEMYPDSLNKTTSFFNKQIEPFIKKIVSKQFPQTIYLNKLQYEIPFLNSTAVNDFFTHAEFIVTYKKFDEILVINRKNILNYLLTKTKDAIIEIQNSFQSHFDRPVEISTPFPYSWIMNGKKSDIILFFQNHPKYFMSQNKFVIQSTIGIQITHSIPIIKILTSEFIRVGGNPIYDIINRVESYSINIFKNYRSHWKTPPLMMQSFLFLLFYSALTRNFRKSKALFVIRHSMFLLAKTEIHKDDLDLLDLIILNDYFSDSTAQYVNNILIQDNLTLHKRLETQNLVDVTTIPYDEKSKIIYIEYRGFRTVLTKHCKNSLSANLYLNDILLAKPFING